MSPEQLLAILVNYQTVAGNDDAMVTALDFIEDYFGRCGLYVSRRSHNGHESLLAGTSQTALSTPRISLAAHLDVVPGSPDLFTLKRSSRRLRGRGAFDMKFAIAAYLRLAARIKDDPKNYDLGFVITTDEEQGGHDGMSWLLDNGYRPRFCVLPDPGSHANWNIETSARGYLQLKVTAKGNSAHAARLWEGSNAVDLLWSFIQQLRDTYFTDQGPDTNTCNVGRMAGGEAANQVPGSAEAYLDFRFMTATDQAQITDGIWRLARKCGMTLDILARGETHHLDISLPMTQALIQSTKEVTHKTISLVQNYGASDARYFDAKGIPCAVLGLPGGGHHGASEWIDRRAVGLLDEVLYHYLRRVATV